MTAPVPRVLVVAEDDLLASFVLTLLNHGVYEPRRVRTVAEGWREVRDWRPHLVVAELEVEHGSGADLISPRRGGEAVPVIVLAKRGGFRGRLDAFERGADDVLTIPFPPEEFVARALSIVKRRHGLTVEFRPSITLGDLELNSLEQKVRVKGRDIELTSREHSLLYVLAGGAGQVVTREQLLAYIYGDDALVVSSNVIDRHVANLRRKLGTSENSSEFIITAVGGYCLRTQTGAP
jgi:two-component system alkaline phosphatase synthesis response regulator PhoP